MIEVKEVSMFYGSVKAVDSISFTAGDGEVLGLLGPNGAGKTTTMNVITGHLVPTSGTAIINSHDVVEEPTEVRKLIGYLPEREPLYPDMEVAEFIRFVGKARGITGGLLQERTDWVLDSCDLRPVYRKLISDLSRGYRQRVGLAQALIHDPKVLILDELTSGLDPLQTSGIRKLVKQLARGGGNGSGKCIIFSTHVMQEAQAVSDRIVIINHGKIVAEGEPDEIKACGPGAENILLTVKGEREDLEKALGGLADVEVEFAGEKGDGFASFNLGSRGGEEFWQPLAEMIKEKGWLVRELTPAMPTLEDAFLALTCKPAGQAERDAEAADKASANAGGEEVQG